MNQYLLKLKFKPYAWTEAKGLFLGISKVKEIILKADSVSHARQRIWEYTPKTFFQYGEYKIIKTQKI